MEFSGRGSYSFVGARPCLCIDRYIDGMIAEMSEVSWTLPRPLVAKLFGGSYRGGIARKRYSVPRKP